MQLLQQVNTIKTLDAKFINRQWVGLLTRAQCSDGLMEESFPANQNAEVWPIATGAESNRENQMFRCLSKTTMIKMFSIFWVNLVQYPRTAISVSEDWSKFSEPLQFSTEVTISILHLHLFDCTAHEMTHIYNDTSSEYLYYTILTLKQLQKTNYLTRDTGGSLPLWTWSLYSGKVLLLTEYPSPTVVSRIR